MVQQVITIGNSVGVIIPKNVVKENKLKVGDQVEIDIRPVKPNAKGVDAKFMKMVDDFVEEHKDVLQKLAQK